MVEVELQLDVSFEDCGCDEDIGIADNLLGLFTDSIEDTRVGEVAVRCSRVDAAEES